MKNALKHNIYSGQNDLEETRRVDFLNKTAKMYRSEDEGIGMGWIVAAVIASFIAVVVLIYFIDAQNHKQQFSLNYVSDKMGLRSKWLTFMGVRNILVLGVDSNGKHSEPFEGTRSDTIMIVSIDGSKHSVNLLSIPRDSKIYLAGGKGVDKINAAHALGGAGLAVRTIENNLGIDINNYIVVDFQGVREIVDAIGGVPINVNKRMRYTDRTAGLYVNLYPGYQVLDAESAEEYLRFRHDAMGDIGRIERQQEFFNAVLKKLNSGEVVFKTPKIMEIMNKYVKTDMNPFEVTKLINVAMKIKPENVKKGTLPGHPSEHGYISYWILDTDETQAMIDSLIYRDGEESTN